MEIVQQLLHQRDQLIVLRLVPSARYCDSDVRHPQDADVHKQSATASLQDRDVQRIKLLWSEARTLQGCGDVV